MLAIDDLHWADTPSLRWLCYLARRLEGLPLLVAVTTRPPEQGRDPGAARRAARRSGDDADPARARCGASRSARSIRRRFDEDGDEAFAAAVEAATRGNPLLVLALLDTVAREGVRPHADQAHMLLELGPVVVGRAVSLRLARAAGRGDGAARGGGDPRRRHRASARSPRSPGSSPAPAAKAARILLRSDLLIRDDPVEFFHPVVRTAIYDGLDTLARSEGHRRAAAVLVEAGALPEQAAAHLLATVAGQRPVRRRDAARGGAALAQPGRRRGGRRLPQARAGGGRRRRDARRGARRARPRRAADRRHRRGRAPRRRARAARPTRAAAPRSRSSSAACSSTSTASPSAMAVLERVLARDEPRRRCPICTSGSRPSSSPRRWWVPETFPVAAARLEALDLDSAARRLRQRPAARRRDVLRVPARRRPRGGDGARAAGARLGRARRERRARLPVRRVLARQHRALRRGDRRLRRRARSRPSGAATCCARRRSACSARARSCCAATSTRALGRAARRARADHGAAASTRRSRTRSASSPRRCSSAASRPRPRPCSRRPGCWTSCR